MVPPEKYRLTGPLATMTTVKSKPSTRRHAGDKGLVIVRDVKSLRRHIDAWRAKQETIGLIPTMGALHDGHLSLIRAAMRDCDRVIATIFVNPTQFAPSEDFASYPRDEAVDIARLEQISTDLLFAPDVDAMYADGFSTAVSVSGLSQKLCGASRPHFFGGVATVVAKLLIQAMPDHAYFGEKDFQQLQVIRRMARDLDIPTRIVGVSTVREADGLAMSSRNWYLSPDERKIAPVLYRVLCETAQAVAAGGACADAAERGRKELAAAGFTKIDYLSICDSQTLEEAEFVNGPARVLVAAYLGATRLIDNVAVEQKIS
jgi:pantoate--beta-alanine ligase